MTREDEIRAVLRVYRDTEPLTPLVLDSDMSPAAARALVLTVTACLSDADDGTGIVPDLASKLDPCTPPRVVAAAQALVAARIAEAMGHKAPIGRPN